LYSVGNSVTVTWAAAPPDSEGVVPCYKVTVTINGIPSMPYIVCGTSTTISAAAGQTVTVTVQAVNPSDNSVTGASSTSTIRFIDPNGDDDHDGMTNAQEDSAGTNPFDPYSVLRVTGVSRPNPSNISLTWSSVSGKQYVIQGASAPGGTYIDIPGTAITATGASTSETIPSTPPAFYRVRIGP
jgi:hypothetical protein